MADAARHLPARPASFLRRFAPVILVLAALLLLLASLGFWMVSRTDLRDIIRWAGKQAGYSVEAKVVERPAYGKLVVRDLTVNDFARIDYLEFNWSLSSLAKRTLDALWVRGLEIHLGRMQAALAARKPASADTGPAPAFPFTLRNLIIADSRLILDNLGPGIPPLPVRLGEITPLVFNDLHLGGSSTDPAAQEVQIADIEDLTLYSPYEQFSPVLTFRRIRIGFSWAGIERQQLDLLLLEEPIIYVGPDLFWFSDQLKEAAAQAQATSSGPPTLPWTVNNFEIRAGGLILTGDGRQSLRLPLIFETRETGLVLSDFSELRLSRAGFTIPLTNLAYPEYQVRVEGLQGQLFFSLPVEERGKKDLSNLTPTLKIAKASWKGLEVSDLVVSATFDRQGIYGAIYGQCYQGQINGGFTILLDQAMSWNAWASTTGLDLAPITQLLSPEHFVMRGTVDSTFNVLAGSRTIDTFTGRIELNRPGTMEITAIDRVLADLPADWAPLKRELSRVGLQAFQFYEYSGGHATLAYKPPLSSFSLSLDGQQGRRNFKLTWEDKGLLAGQPPAPRALSKPQTVSPP